MSHSGSPSLPRRRRLSAICGLQSTVGSNVEFAGGGIADENRHPTWAQEFADGIEE